MNFKNMGPDPPYQFAVMDNTTYMRTQQVSDWSCVPGWTLHSCVFDIMHNLYLGTGRDVVASCLRVLVERGAFDLFGLGRGSAEMFPQITQEIHSTFKEHRFLDSSHKQTRSKANFVLRSFRLACS